MSWLLSQNVGGALVSGYFSKGAKKTCWCIITRGFFRCL